MERVINVRTKTVPLVNDADVSTKFLHHSVYDVTDIAAACQHVSMSACQHTLKKQMAGISERGGFGFVLGTG